jgi:serine/threonine protein kinase
LYDHLERCEACCARMEQLAGGEQWQQEAASLLTTDELDAAVPEPMVWSEVDFSVEHLDPSEDANVLGQLGGYDVHAIIGRGGMGVVLKAFDRELQRFVALKALSPNLAHSSVARKRFAREAQAAAAVVNPHVIAIHHVQPTGRLPFLIMPLLTGESLAQRLKSRAPLELTEVLRIGTQAAVGLAAAHDQGLVHRDVKPANIFLEKGVERVVITDFGLARAADDVSMTRLGVVAGTPEYMSPEQARGAPLDGRSDLFSLGCVLYEMATGVSPFRSDSTIATLLRIVDDKSAAIASLAPEIPSWFSYIVERLLSKDPAQRFASASEVASILEQCLSHLQQPTSVPLPASLEPQVKGRRSTFSANKKGILTMLGTLGTALLGIVLWQATDPPDISGQWTSDEWGTVVLRGKGHGEYEGTFTGSDKYQPAYDIVEGGGSMSSDGMGMEMQNAQPVLAKAKLGKVELKWSRLERCFSGTWRKGINRNGKISLRLLNHQIHGAWTTNKFAQKESDSPRLADMLWQRSAIAVPDGGSQH